MLVFIDESGDPGLAVAAGSSPVFVLAMVIFEDHAEASRTQSIIEQTRARLGIRPEFKFNKCRADLRDAFFDAVSDCRFRVRAIVVQKNLIRSPRVGADTASLYAHFLKALVRFDDGALKEAKVVIDGSGAREFKRRLGAYMQRHARAGAISQIKLKGSRGEPVLQLADMCVGAIARSHRTDHRKSARWSARLSGKLDGLWELE